MQIFKWCENIIKITKSISKTKCEILTNDISPLNIKYQNSMWRNRMLNSQFYDESGNKLIILANIRDFDCVFYALGSGKRIISMLITPILPLKCISVTLYFLRNKFHFLSQNHILFYFISLKWRWGSPELQPFLNQF